MSVIAAETQMYREAQEAPAIVADQIDKNAKLNVRLGALLREYSPNVVITCARGSSDHAATYAKYLIETKIGIPTASAAPSVSSVYLANQNMRSTLFVAISQSGKSPDLLATAKAAKRSGALVFALVNNVESPLAELADEVVPLRAGAEISVAATKSYIATLAAIASLVAEWSRNVELRTALQSLPDKLTESWSLEWHEAVSELRDATNFFVIGRGVGLGVAQEAALKFKETAGLHAEAFSAAEVRHGPMAIVKSGFPVLVFTQEDATQSGFDPTVEDFIARGATVMVTGKHYVGAAKLPWTPADSSVAPMLFIQSFYRMVNALAAERGYDPDKPPHLRKVTETV